MSHLYLYLFQNPLPLPTAGILGVVASTFGFFFSSTAFQNPSILFPISSLLSNLFHLSSFTRSSSSFSFLNFSTSALQSIFFFSFLSSTSFSSFVLPFPFLSCLHLLSSSISFFQLSSSVSPFCKASI